MAETNSTDIQPTKQARKSKLTAVPRAPRFHEHGLGADIPGLPAPMPCPFCQKVEYGGIVTCAADDIATTYHVECDHCCCAGPAASSQLEAAQRWNAAHNSTTPPVTDKVTPIGKRTSRDVHRLDKKYDITSRLEKVEAALEGAQQLIADGFGDDAAVGDETDIMAARCVVGLAQGEIDRLRQEVEQL